MALKDLEIKYAARRSKEYKLFDGDGFYVLAKPSEKDAGGSRAREASPSPRVRFRSEPLPNAAGREPFWRKAAGSSRR